MRRLTIHNGQAPEQPSHLPLVDISQLLDEVFPPKLHPILQNIDVLASVADRLALHGPNFPVEVPHAAEAFHQDVIAMEVFVGGVGRITE